MRIKIKLPSFLRFLSKKGDAVTEQVLQLRIRRISEEFLGNESLTEEADDSTANVLLDWGLDCVKRVVQGTKNLDDAQANEAMSERLRAIRQVLRLAGKWTTAAQTADPASQSSLLERILEQASIVYGGSSARIDEMKKQALLQQLRSAQPAEVVSRLRALLDERS